MYQRILSDPLLFPADMSHDAKSIMTGLLHRDPSRRLGAGGADEGSGADREGDGEEARIPHREI